METTTIKPPVRLTNTQYMRVGDVTNVGTVHVIHSNQGFTTTEGWYYNLQEQAIFKVKGK